MRSIYIVFSILVTMSIFGCSTTIKYGHPFDPFVKESHWNHLSKHKLDYVAHLFLGHFSNIQQLDTLSTGYSEGLMAIKQDILNRPIWPSRRGNEFWGIYVWFNSDFLERPLSTGVWRMSKYAPDTIKIEWFDLPEEKINEAEAWKSDHPLSKISPKYLIPKECDQFIVRQSDGKFKMLYSDAPCLMANDFKILYSNVSIDFEETGFETITIFFDQHKQVSDRSEAPTVWQRIERTKIREPKATR